MTTYCPPDEHVWAPLRDPYEKCVFCPATRNTRDIELELQRATLVRERRIIELMGIALDNTANSTERLRAAWELGTLGEVIDWNQVP